MNTISVSLPSGSYEIHVGRGLFPRIQDQLHTAGLREPFVLISQPRILKAVGYTRKRHFITATVPDGERAKTLANVGRVIDVLVRTKMTRQSTVVALGGGVVGDVAAFAASIYMRGIAVVHVPTTLLAQLDSSIGGKTAVNHPVAKNLIGTFHQPRLVISDPELLRTLPKREYTSGLYEALKCGVIMDAGLFDDFGHRIGALLARDAETVEWLVARCAGIKANVVMSDEREAGQRRILNFGHTVGHALEAAGKFQRLKHGEAVGYGMIAATRIAASLRLLSDGDQDRIEKAVAAIGPLPRIDGFDTRRIFEALERDKKTRDGAVHFVLPRAIGRVEITPDVPMTVVRRIVQGLLDESSRTN